MRYAVITLYLGANALMAAGAKGRTAAGVAVVWDVQRIQAEGNTLQVIEEIVVRNASNPPRTLANFEIQLPAEAEIVAGAAQPSSGQRVMLKPTPGDRKGQYSFPFPLGSGDSRFAVGYRLPYKGEAMIEPKFFYPLERLVVRLPKTMKFEAKTPGTFQPMPGRPGVYAQVAAPVKPGQTLAFRISGAGTLVETSGAGPRPAVSAAGPAESGTPAASPDPLHSVRWFILGGLSLVLVAGVAGFLAHRRKQAPQLSP